MPKSPKKNGKNSLMSKEGLKMLGKASARATADIEKRTKQPARLEGKVPPQPPGSRRARLVEQRMQERNRFRTGNVREVPRTGGRTRIGNLSGLSGRGGAGAGGLLGSKIR